MGVLLTLDAEQGGIIRLDEVALMAVTHVHDRLSVPRSVGSF